MNHRTAALSLTLAALAALNAQAQPASAPHAAHAPAHQHAPAPAAEHGGLRVENAWARATVPGQKATGVFMQLHTLADARLLSASSPLSSITEVHEMRVDAQGVMRMRELPQGLPLPAGQTVALQPGGHHIMLMDLQAPLQAGDSVPLTLLIESGGQRQRLNITATVRPLAPAQGQGHAPSAHKH